MKLIIILLLILILGSLASAMVFLVRDQGKSTRTVKALTWRIGLSLSAFLLLMAGYYLGLIQPHGII